MPRGHFERGARHGVPPHGTAERGGKGRGVRNGIFKATGQYVGFLNNDARPDPGWIRAARSC